MDFNKLVEYVANNLTDKEKELITGGENGKIGLHGEITERYGGGLVDDLITCGIIQAIPYCPYYYLSQLGSDVKTYISEHEGEDKPTCGTCKYFVDKDIYCFCNHHPKDFVLDRIDACENYERADE